MYVIEYRHSERDTWRRDASITFESRATALDFIIGLVALSRIVKVK